LTVDPVLYRGDIEYDLARILWSRLDEMDDRAVHVHFDTIVSEARLDEARAVTWVIFVRWTTGYGAPRARANGGSGPLRPPGAAVPAAAPPDDLILLSGRTHGQCCWHADEDALRSSAASPLAVHSTCTEESSDPGRSRSPPPASRTSNDPGATATGSVRGYPIRLHSRPAPADQGWLWRTVWVPAGQPTVMNSI